MTARARTLAFPLALGALLLWRPAWNGATPGELARFVAFALAFVLGPGWLVQGGWSWVGRSGAPEALERGARDPAVELGLAGALGCALLVVACLALDLLGARGLLPAYPLAFAPLLLRRAGRPRGPAPRRGGAEASAGHLVALLLLVATAVYRTHPGPADAWWWDQSPELLFHVGNAAELAHHWPLQNPRMAGEPLNYHFFAYALPAAASRITGVPVYAWMARLDPALVPVLLALALYAAGSLIFRSAGAGVAAAALVVLHVDVGSELARGLGLRPAAPVFGSLLHFGVFQSRTTAQGLLFFTGLAIAVWRWLEAPAGQRFGRLPPVALFAFAASGTKGSVMPVVWAGTLGLALLARWRPRPGAAPLHLLLLFLVGVSLPMTVYLAAGAGSFAPAMFQLSPGASVCATGLFQAAQGALPALAGPGCPPLALALAPLWLAGYLGLLGLPGLVWVVARARGSGSGPGPGTRGVETWLLLCALAGAGLALLLAAPAGSQLFFLYNGEIGLALLSGAALSRLRPARPAQRAAAAAAALLAVPMLGGSLRAVGAELRRDAAPAQPAPRSVSAYGEGLAFLRERTPADALLVARHEGILLSALAERRVLFETDSYSPQAYGSPVAASRRERRALGARLLADPRPADLAALRALVPGAGPLYLVRDDLRLRRAPAFFTEVRPAPGALPAHPGSDGAARELVFANEAVRIVRLPGGAAGPRAATARGGRRAR